MVFLSLSDLSILMCAHSDEDDSAHLGSKKEAIFAEILGTGFGIGLLQWSICIFCGNRSVKLLDLNQVTTVLNQNVTDLALHTLVY